MSKTHPCCAFHPEVEAAYRCSVCSKTLCPQCVTQELNLFFCVGCKSYATRMESRPEVLSTRETVKQVSRELQGVGLAVINHIIIPVAVILMVGSFLFFLLDVRSVYFNESLAVRRVAFFFGAATVLIARYGRMYFARGRQLLYTLLLAIATSLVMLQFSRGVPDLIVNVLVLGSVWWMATQITDCLDMGEEAEEEKQHIYGVERLRREAVHRELKLHPGRQLGSEAHAKEAVDPSSAVARLAVIALLAFALGEPVILAGKPEADYITKDEFTEFKEDLRERFKSLSGELG